MIETILRPRSLLVVILLAGCDARDAPDRPAMPRLVATVGGGTVSAPDSVAAGWTRLEVLEDGAGHILVLFRLPPSGAGSGLDGFLAELDTAPTTTAPALGGPEVGDTGAVVLRLDPGEHLLACVRRGADGHRHAFTGEVKRVVVRAADAAGDSGPDTTGAQVRLADFAFAGPATWPAGPQLVRVENVGAQLHHLVLARLEPGRTMEDWVEAEKPGKIAKAIAGVARMSPGQTAYLPVDLVAGDYVLYCLITDPGSGMVHVEMGMRRGIRVGDLAGR